MAGVRVDSDGYALIIVYHCILNVLVMWLLTGKQLITFIGPTELEILNNIEDIVVQALPLEKLKKTYADLNTSKNLLLNRVSFCQSRVDVSMHSNFTCNNLYYNIITKRFPRNNILSGTARSLV